MNMKNKTSLSVVVVVLLTGAVSCASASGAEPGPSGDPAAPGPLSGAGGTSGGPSAPSGAGGDPGFFNPGNGGPGAPRDTCASASYQGTLIPSSLLFIMDRSGSMNCNLPPLTNSAACEAAPQAVDPTQPTKWSVINGTMSAAFDRLATVPSASVGLGFFSIDDSCTVQSLPTVGIGPLTVPHMDGLKQAMRDVKPKGGTPIIGATILAYHHLQQEAQVSGNRFVVLVTDGTDSCVGKYPVGGDVVSRLLDIEMPKASKVNIRTFVIGAPGSESNRGFLSKMAFAGGTARDASCDHASADPAPGHECHFDMTRSSDFAKDLGDALQRIGGSSAMTCDFDVPKAADGKPVDTQTINVDYFKAGNSADPAAKVELYRDDTKPCEAGANGWQYIEGNTRIRVCGATCDQVHTDAKAQVVVSVGCQQRVR
jgi:hypothetical protein